MSDYEWPENDHLSDELQAAIVRFASEDHCTPQQWAGRAVRYVAVERYFGQQRRQVART